MGRQKSWSLAEHEYLEREIVARNKSVLVIARELDRTKSSVIGHATRSGFLPRQEPMKRRWTPEDWNEVKSMVGVGYNLHEIALKVKRTVGAVNEKIRNMRQPTSRIISTLPPLRSLQE